MLDTSILVDLQRGNRKTIADLERLSRASDEPARISFMTYMEFLKGTERCSLERKAKLNEFLWDFPVLHTTNNTGLILAKLKFEYDNRGKKKSVNDLFIASQTIEHNLTLITKDQDFRDISEVKKVILP